MCTEYNISISLTSARGWLVSKLLPGMDTYSSQIRLDRPVTYFQRIKKSMYDVRRKS